MKYILVLSAIALSFALVILSIPPILRISRAKNLYEPFEERKIHTRLIPPLGGVAIFIGFLLASVLASYQIDFNSLKYVILAATIMFFIGLKDDLIVISARKKFLIQIFSALLVIVLGNFRFTNLHGMLGIYEINYALSLIISLFFIIAVTNAYNLIDGIDGLASGLAMVGTTALGTWFLSTGNYEYALICASLLGGLMAFFLFNVFGQTNKIFMGDSGSLIIGIVISMLVIKFNELNIGSRSLFAIHAAPALSLAILIVPVIDLLRVMSIRIRNKKSPFHADKNHIHHLLLLLMNNHLKVTLTLVFTTLIAIGGAISLNHSGLNTNYQFAIVLLTGIALSQIPSLLIRLQHSKDGYKQREKREIATPVFKLQHWMRTESSENLIYKSRIHRRITNGQKLHEEKPVLPFEYRS